MYALVEKIMHKKEFVSTDNVFIYFMLIFPVHHRLKDMVRINNNWLSFIEICGWICHLKINFRQYLVKEDTIVFTLSCSNYKNMFPRLYWWDFNIINRVKIYVSFFYSSTRHINQCIEHNFLLPSVFYFKFSCMSW